MEPHVYIVSLVKELRKSLLSLLLIISGTTLGFYFLTPFFFKLLQAHLNQKLAFYTVAEPFLAHVKLAVALALAVLMPWLLYLLWRALAHPFKLSKGLICFFVLATCLLFYAGAAFCFFVTLPFGVNFLLGFESDQLKPVIAISQFVSFVCLFILAFGCIFELPIFMIFTAKVGLISRQAYKKNRRYAVLIISIAAALLTPTPDIVNMLLMGGPLYLLYEFGIILIRLMRIPSTS